VNIRDGGFGFIIPSVILLTSAFELGCSWNILAVIVATKRGSLYSSFSISRYGEASSESDMTKTQLKNSPILTKSLSRENHKKELPGDDIIAEYWRIIRIFFRKYVGGRRLQPVCTRGVEICNFLVGTVSVSDSVNVFSRTQFLARLRVRGTCRAHLNQNEMNGWLESTWNWLVVIENRAANEFKKEMPQLIDVYDTIPIVIASALFWKLCFHYTGL
jgi:hypothetical protein